MHDEPLRYAVVGAGAGIFASHRSALAARRVVGMADVQEEPCRQRAGEFACPAYRDYLAMLAETRPDFAVVLAPHPQHAAIAIECMRAGCHVLVEKPMAVSADEADAMIEVAQQTGRVLAVVFQQRFRPEVVRARALIQEGRLGALQRVNCVATWMRTAAYYSSSGWRGTWAGEGGGVLLNQAPHQLDLLCHLVGMPRRVFAWTRTRLHDIETEDTAQAILEWPSGALGSFRASTAEAGAPEVIEVAGTAGSLRIRPGELAVAQLETDVREFIRTNPNPFAAPPERDVEVELEAGASDHLGVYRNLDDALHHRAPLMADGAQGRMSLELANAMIYSSYTHQEVDLPLDRVRYAALLAELRAHPQPPA